MSETLRQYLDRIGIKSGNDSGFVVQNGSTEMQVSRRYLESEPWRDILEKEIVDYEYPYVNMYGQKTIKLFVK